jgi:hypothetical protein
LGRSTDIDVPDTPNGKAHWIKLLGDEILPEKKDILVDPKAMEVGPKHPLTVRIRAKVFSDGSKPNLSVIEFTQGDQEALWLGPVIVFGQRCPHDPKRFRDITLDDIGYLLEFFNSYHNAPFHDHAALEMDEALSKGKLNELEKSNPMLFNSIMYKYASEERIKAVEIACKGDQEFMNLEKFRSINIPPNHPLFSFRPTKVTKLMGLPLRIRSVAPDLAWRDKRRTIFLPHHNEIAWWLNMCVDTADRAFGVADPDGDLDIRGGRVQVVRKDGKDISPHQVEALAAFFAAEVAPHARRVDALVSKNCNKAGVDGELRQRMLAKSRQSEVLDFFLNRTYFEACFAVLKRLKIAAGDKSWESEKSPYDTVVDNGDQEDDEEEDEVELGEDEQVEMKLERMCERLEQHDGGCVMC